MISASEAVGGHDSGGKVRRNPLVSKLGRGFSCAERGACLDRGACSVDSVLLLADVLPGGEISPVEDVLAGGEISPVEDVLAGVEISPVDDVLFVKSFDNALSGNCPIS